MTLHQMDKGDAAWLHMGRPTNLMVVNPCCGSTSTSTGTPCEGWSSNA